MEVTPQPGAPTNPRRPIRQILSRLAAESLITINKYGQIIPTMVALEVAALRQELQEHPDWPGLCEYIRSSPYFYDNAIVTVEDDDSPYYLLERWDEYARHTPNPGLIK